MSPSAVRKRLKHHARCIRLLDRCVARNPYYRIPFSGVSPITKIEKKYVFFLFRKTRRRILSELAAAYSKYLVVFFFFYLTSISMFTRRGGFSALQIYLPTQAEIRIGGSHNVRSMKLPQKHGQCRFLAGTPGDTPINNRNILQDNSSHLSKHGDCERQARDRHAAGFEVPGVDFPGHPALSSVGVNFRGERRHAALCFPLLQQARFQTSRGACARTSRRSCCRAWLVLDRPRYHRCGCCCCCLFYNTGERKHDTHI